MRTRVTKRSQTSVPSGIRKRYRIRAGDMLEWIENGPEIRIIPIPADAIRALRGRARGEDLTARLLTSREEDARLDDPPPS